MAADSEVFKKITKPFYQYKIADSKGLKALYDALENQFSGKFSANILGNYFHYSLLQNFENYFPSFVHIDHDEQKSPKKDKVVSPRNYLSKLNNPKIDANVSQKCYNEISNYFGYVLGRIFTEKKLPTVEKRERFHSSIKHLVDNILVGMQSMIDGLSWMTPESKKGAYSKIQNIVTNIAYPDWLFDNKVFTKYYSGINKHFSKSNLPQMELYLLQFSLQQQYEQLLLTEMNRNVWIGSPADDGSFYFKTLNSFVMPMGLLQQPLFDPEWPASVNYGAIGLFVGHELTHGFDNDDVQLGPFGEHQKWLDSDSQKHFDEMSDCLIQEYNQFWCPLNSHCTYGELIVVESIADNGGIHAAYRAYRNIQDFYGPDPLLPGELASLFTHDQLFFLSFAQQFCYKINPDTQFLFDRNSPFKVRVLGTVRNFPAFRTAFNCPIGSTSAPKDHCNVWISDVKLPQKPPISLNALNIPETLTIKADNSLFTKYSQAQAFFQASMNLSADPCQDFYSYACGKSGESAVVAIGDGILKKMENALNEMIEPDYEGPMLESEAIKKTLNFYSKCKNGTSQKPKDENFVKGKLDDFEALTGYKFNWCDMSASNNNKTDPAAMAKALAWLSVNYRISTFIRIDVDVNPRRDSRFSSNNSLIIDENSATYVKPFYLPGAWEKFTYEALKTNMQKLLQSYTKSIGIECKPNVMGYNVETIVEFEHFMATNLSTDETLRRNYSLQVNPMQIKNIPYKFVDWATFITAISNISGVDFLGESNAEDYWVIMSQPKSIQAFDEYISVVGMDVLVKYLYYRLLLHFQPMLADISDNDDDGKYVRLYPEFSTTLGRKPPPKDPFFLAIEKSTLSEICASNTFRSFSYPFARIFTEISYLSLAAKATFKKKTFKIIDSIKNSMQSMLEDLPWISKDEKSLKGARDKIDNLQINAPFPDFMMNDSELDKFYGDLKIEVNDSFEEIEQKIAVFKRYNKFKGLLPGTSVDRADYLAPMAVNAWYNPGVNSITIPEGILQQPLFDPDFPASINFGGIGVIIGHEITHGFDDEGIQFDGEGIQETWMSEESQKIFDQMAQCVVEEYGNFTVIDDPSYSPRNLNGKNTQGENIADNGGIHAAYISYLRWISLNGPDPQLPDRFFGQLSHDQLFFLSFAQPWCGAKRESIDDLFQSILSDPHSPPKYRVFGTIQNFPAFRDAFNCPLNSNYAPRKHCSVWVPKN